MMRQMVKMASVRNSVVNNTISVSLLFNNCFDPFHFPKNIHRLYSKHSKFIFLTMKKLLIFIIFGVNGGKRKKGDKGGEKCYKNCLCDTKLIDCHGQGFGEFLVNTDESDITTVTKLDLR